MGTTWMPMTWRTTSMATSTDNKPMHDTLFSLPYTTMFSDWTDPYDIDNYTDDIVFTTRPAPSSNMYMRMTTKDRTVEPPIGQVINGVKHETNAVEPTSADRITKEAEPFDVMPGSIFSDGHPVGSQPKINILRSADRETYHDKKSFQLTTEWMYVIVVTLAFFYLILMYISVKAQLCSTQTSFEMLMRMYCSKMAPQASA